MMNMTNTGLIGVTLLAEKYVNIPTGKTCVPCLTETNTRYKCCQCCVYAVEAHSVLVFVLISEADHVHTC